MCVDPALDRDLLHDADHFGGQPDDADARQNPEERGDPVKKRRQLNDTYLLGYSADFDNPTQGTPWSTSSERSVHRKMRR
jgi:hypothetical protein